MSETNGGQPAGWYPDPEMANTLRYWDGGGWTEHRAPSAGPPPASALHPKVQAEVSQAARWIDTAFRVAIVLAILLAGGWILDQIR